MECDGFVFEIIASSLINDLSKLIEQNLTNSSQLLNHDKKPLLMSLLEPDEKKDVSYLKENEVCLIKIRILFKNMRTYFGQCYFILKGYLKAIREDYSKSVSKAKSKISQLIIKLFTNAEKSMENFKNLDNDQTCSNETCVNLKNLDGGNLTPETRSIVTSDSCGNGEVGNDMELESTWNSEKNQALCSDLSLNKEKAVNTSKNEAITSYYLLISNLVSDVNYSEIKQLSKDIKKILIGYEMDDYGQRSEGLISF